MSETENAVPTEEVDDTTENAVEQTPEEESQYNGGTQGKYIGKCQSGLLEILKYTVLLFEKSL